MSLNRAKEFLDQSNSSPVRFFFKNIFRLWLLGSIWKLTRSSQRIIFYAYRSVSALYFMKGVPCPRERASEESLPQMIQPNLKKPEGWGLRCLQNGLSIQRRSFDPREASSMPGVVHQEHTSTRGSHNPTRSLLKSDWTTAKNFFKFCRMRHLRQRLHHHRRSFHETLHGLR